MYICGLCIFSSAGSNYSLRSKRSGIVEIKSQNTVPQLARAHRTLQSKPQKPDPRFPIFSAGGCMSIISSSFFLSFFLFLPLFFSFLFFFLFFFFFLLFTFSHSFHNRIAGICIITGYRIVFICFFTLWSMIVVAAHSSLAGWLAGWLDRPAVVVVRFLSDQKKVYAKAKIKTWPGDQN